MKLVSALSFFLAGARFLLAAEGAAASNPWNGQAGELQTYVLSPNDFLELRVYQEEDLTTKFRVAKDGTVNLPLVGVVEVGGKTVDQSTRIIRELLNKDYLVNPQVTLTVVEYAKRRFTVLGQVQRPGSFEFPNEETVTLLQAVAMAGGYTRLANAAKITITRTVDGKKQTFQVDGKAAAKDPDTKAVMIAPEDTISVAERVF